MPITFDEKSSRYRDDRGRFVSESQVRGTVERAGDTLERDLRKIAKDLNSGKINLAEFQIQSAEKIKSAHVFAAAVGKGGRAQMTVSDWGKLGNEIREQYAHLNKFARDIESGKVSPARIEYRASLYSKPPRSVFFKNEKFVKSRSGATLVKRVLHALESCTECAGWAARGFVPVDVQPDIGALVCKSFCRCSLEYTNQSAFGDTFGALGTWERLEEEEDPSIVKQKDGTCVAAVGEMLAKHHGLGVSQEEIITNIGAWSNAESLARYLNSKETRKGVKWKGGYVALPGDHYITGITEDVTVWGVMLRDKEAVGHAVLVYGTDRKGLIKIKDPYDQTKYKMTVKELYRVLSEIVVVVK